MISSMSQCINSNKRSQARNVESGGLKTFISGLTPGEAHLLTLRCGCSEQPLGVAITDYACVP